MIKNLKVFFKTKKKQTCRQLKLIVLRYRKQIQALYYFSKHKIYILCVKKKRSSYTFDLL